MNIDTNVFAYTTMNRSPGVAISYLRFSPDREIVLFSAVEVTAENCVYLCLQSHEFSLPLARYKQSASAALECDPQ